MRPNGVMTHYALTRRLTCENAVRLLPRAKRVEPFSSVRHSAALLFGMPLLTAVVGLQEPGERGL